MDIDKRVLELTDMGGAGWVTPENALKIALEAADARAEEIAQRIDSINTFSRSRSVEDHCASIARSTIRARHEREAPKEPPVAAGAGIKKPEASEVLARSFVDGIEGQAFAEEKPLPTMSEYYAQLRVAPDGTLSGTLPCGHPVEDILASFTTGATRLCGRCSIMPQPTREQRLEAALRNIAAGATLTEYTKPADRSLRLDDRLMLIAIRALEGK